MQFAKDWYLVKKVFPHQLVRVEGGWGEGVSHPPFINLDERGMGDPFTPAFGPLLPHRQLLPELRTVWRALRPSLMAQSQETHSGLREGLMLQAIRAHLAVDV